MLTQTAQPLAEQQEAAQAMVLEQIAKNPEFANLTGEQKGRVRNLAIAMADERAASVRGTMAARAAAYECLGEAIKSVLAEPAKPTSPTPAEDDDDDGGLSDTVLIEIDVAAESAPAPAAKPRLVTVEPPPATVAPSVSPEEMFRKERRAIEEEQVRKQTRDLEIAAARVRAGQYFQAAFARACKQPFFDKTNYCMVDLLAAAFYFAPVRLDGLKLRLTTQSFNGFVGDVVFGASGIITGVSMVLPVRSKGGKKFQLMVWNGGSEQAVKQTAPWHEETQNWHLLAENHTPNFPARVL